MYLSALILALVAFGLPLAVEAQEAAKVWRIGLLLGYSPDLDQPLLTAFKDGLRDLGYLEGRNVVIDVRYFGGARAERIAGLTAELARSKVDIFVVHGFPQAVRAAEQASNVPVVFVASTDPIGAGLVASLARPGGRVTGVSDLHRELAAKRLELLKEAVPSISRVAVLHNATPGSLGQLRDTQTAASHLRLTVVPVEIRPGPDPTDIDGAFTRIRREGAEALNVLSGAAGIHQSRVSDFAVKSRIPAIGTVRRATEAGYLMSYGANFAALYYRAATYVDKVLKGTRPGDLPVEQPTKFDLVINMKTAKQLRLTIAPSLLLRADMIIE